MSVRGFRPLYHFVPFCLLILAIATASHAAEQSGAGYEMLSANGSSGMHTDSANDGFAMSSDRADYITVQNVTGCHNDTKVVEVWLNNPVTAVDTFDFDLTYNINHVDYQSYAQGTLVPSSGWLFFMATENTPGTVHCAATCFQSSIPAGSNGSLIRLTFTVICSACQNGNTSNLTLSNLDDDIFSFTSQNGVFTYYCAPTATPTSAVTATPSPTLTATPTNTLVPTDTPTLTPTNTLAPTNSPTLSPTATSTLVPTNTPTLTPTNTLAPTNSPTLPPTLSPTATDTLVPTNPPTLTPTNTLVPTNSPTLSPTVTNTLVPTNTPTQSPTLTTTATPTNTPQPPTVTPAVTSTPTLTPTLAPIPANSTAGIITLLLVFLGLLAVSQRRK